MKQPSKRSTVTIGQILQLRFDTQTGSAICVKALEATNGDIDKAKDWLRKRGIVRSKP